MNHPIGIIKYNITWTTLGEFLTQLEAKGVSPNVASFVGAGTVREYVLGWDNIVPSDAQLSQMQDLVREAMREGVC